MERFWIRAAAPVFNAPVAAVATSPRLGGMVNRYLTRTNTLTILSYTGPRSGRRFSIPVTCRRAGDKFVIDVWIPEAKTWWRNFLGEGRPLTLRLDGTERAGHAVARRDQNGRVTVTVRLTTGAPEG
ncbi:hypothetical protein E2F47_03080 [Mycobacterium eburneum]|nr:hypothetical protein E2F47_03080 [Mycobacterium eburneum]